jgi:hypothetical protein
MTSLNGAVTIRDTVVGTCMVIKALKGLHSDLRMPETQQLLD